MAEQDGKDGRVVHCGFVESPVRGDVHAGFGGRARETDRSKGRNRALARPYTDTTIKITP